MNPLVSTLKERASALNLSVTELAKTLGISRSYAYMLLNGEREFGLQTLRSILRVFPELKPEVDAYLADGHEDDA